MITNDAAERAYLAAVLWRPESLFAGGVTATEDHFTDERHRRLLRAFLRLAQRGEAIDVVSVHAEVQRDGRGAFDATYIADLALGEPSSARLDLLEEARVRRQVDWAGRQLVQVADDGKLEPAGEFFRLVEETSRELVAHRDAAVDLHAVAPRIVESIFQRKPGALSGLAMGFADLDDALDGLPRGEVVVIAGRVSTGKSALLQQIACNVAGRKERVLFFSPEMSHEQFTLRALARAAGVPLKPLRRNSLTDEQRAALMRAGAALPFLLIDDQGTPTVGDFVATSIRHAFQQPLALIVVDYLQYVSEPLLRGESEPSRLGRMVKVLKDLARRLNVPVLVGSQVNREGEKTADGRPTLANLKGSGAIEEHADVVVMIHRPAKVKDGLFAETVAELLIRKNRNGETGTEHLRWDGTTTAFANLAKNWRDEFVAASGGNGHDPTCEEVRF